MDAQSHLFYSINSEKEKMLFEKAYIFFDTSALLDFYYYSEATKKDIFKNLFVTLKKRLWITAQTEYEFLKNREKVFLKPIDSYDRLKTKGKDSKEGGYIDEIDSIIAETIGLVKNDLVGQFKTLKEQTAKGDKHPYLSDDIFSGFQVATDSLTAYLIKYQDDFKGFKTDVGNKIEEQKALLNSTKTKDLVLEEFNKVFQTTAGQSYEDVLKIIEEGEIRYRNDIPPGYMDDEGKIGFQKYGDLILWKQIISKSKEDDRDILLVINDLKEDWWYFPQKNKPDSPRHELIKELFDASGKTFWMYKISDFLFKAKQLIAPAIKEAAIEDVLNVTKPKYIFDRKSIYNWLVFYFEGPVATINFQDPEDFGIDYVYSIAGGEKIGFSHKYIGKGRYTGLYIPIRNLINHLGKAKEGLELDKICLVLECDTYNDGLVLIKHMSRKNPQNLLNASKGMFRLFIITQEDEKILVIYDSDDYNIVDNIM